MRTQSLQMNLTQKQLDPILFRTEETGREIEFTLLDPDGTAYDLTDYDLKFSMLKPDGNFIYQDLSGGILTQTEQMTTSRGIGYYAIRVSDQDTLIYTGQGKVVIDDHVITDETLESISEVDGLVFPDDFLTVDDHVAVIDDDVTSTDKTWSSSKISYEIDNASVEVSKTIEGNPVIFTDGADAPLVKCVTAINGYQSGTGTPSPDNVRPIVAYTEGEIEVRGKNLIWRDSTNNIYNGGHLIPVTNGDTIWFYGEWTGGALYARLYDSAEEINKNNYTAQLRGISADTTGTVIEISVTRDGYLGIAYSGPVASYTVDKMMVSRTEFTPSDYEPYTSTTHTATFSNSIYQGNADFVNGEVTTEWAVIASYAGETLPGEWISDRDEYAPGTTPTTGAQVAYELATPTTETITPTNLPIKSLVGYNHIESSTGDMEIEYITEDFQPIVDSIEKESGSKTTKLWDAGFTPSPGVWLEYDFGENLENYDALVVEFVVAGWEDGYSDTVTIYPKMQHLNTTKCYHYVKGSDYAVYIFHVSGTIYGLGAASGYYPPQYKAIYGIKY